MILSLTKLVYLKLIYLLSKPHKQFNLQFNILKRFQILCISSNISINNNHTFNVTLENTKSSFNHPTCQNQTIITKITMVLIQIDNIVSNDSKSYNNAIQHLNQSTFSQQTFIKVQTPQHRKCNFVFKSQCSIKFQINL